MSPSSPGDGDPPIPVPLTLHMTETEMNVFGEMLRATGITDPTALAAHALGRLAAHLDLDVPLGAFQPPRRRKGPYGI